MYLFAPVRFRAAGSIPNSHPGAPGGVKPGSTLDAWCIIRRNVVSWGFNAWECDLCILRRLWCFRVPYLRSTHGIRGELLWQTLFQCAVSCSPTYLDCQFFWLSPQLWWGWSRFCCRIRSSSFVNRPLWKKHWNRPCEEQFFMPYCSRPNQLLEKMNMLKTHRKDIGIVFDKCICW